MTTGIVFGLIVLWFSNIPISPPPHSFMEWTREAVEYYETNLPEILKKADVPENFTVRGSVMSDIIDKAEQIAEQTDSIVALIDLRIGMARVWWDTYGPNGTREHDRYSTWEAVWVRITELEEMTNSTPSWDLTYEAVEYYNIWQSNCTVKIFRKELGDTPEYKTIINSFKEKLEEKALHTDNVIDLADLRYTIVTRLATHLNQKYPTLNSARARLEELEEQVGCA